MRQVVLISGPAGCGLSSAEFVFEELGFFVVKNIPGKSVPIVLEEIFKNDVERVCFLAHIRNCHKILAQLKELSGFSFRFILLNTSKETLLKRFALTRHVHPRTVIEKLSPEKAIEKDVDNALQLIPEASYYIDTTVLTVKQLRGKLFSYLDDINDTQQTSITFISFGIKNGIPQGIDTLLDVRLIPNPYWVEELKELTGEDQKVIDYMMSYPVTQEVLNNLTNYLSFYFKGLVNSGRNSYTVGVACSGGQHRSTFVANYLKDYFSKDYRTQVIHRDCERLNKDE